MEWSKAYRPERRVSIEDIAHEIHNRVTIRDVLSVYCPSLTVRGRRCPCPIHNGKDNNFSFTDSGYKCFVCGASGDVISLVKDVCELSTRVDAMKQICKDFNLSIGFDTAVTHDVSLRVKRAREAAAEKQAKREAWWAEYHRLMDTLVDYQKAIETGDQSSPQYAKAVRDISYIEYQLDSLPPEPR